MNLFPCVVVDNSISDFTNPFPGCVKVVNEREFGGSTSLLVPMPLLSPLACLATSDWIPPLVMHPADMYIPELGETVFVFAHGSGHMWLGSHLSFDFENQLQKWMSSANPLLTSPRNGWNPQTQEATDRIFGTRNGSYIKMEDKTDGKIIIEVMGSMSSLSMRAGCKVIFNGNSMFPSITLVAQNSISMSIITVDMQPATGKFLIETADMCKVEILPTGITVQDKISNKIEMKSTGMKLTDSNTNTIEMKATGIDINGGKLTVAK